MDVLLHLACSVNRTLSEFLNLLKIVHVKPMIYQNGAELLKLD